jgi:hypothetical protein
MPFVRHGVLAVALAATIGSAAPAEERATTARPQSTKMPGLPRIAYRSFWPQERYNRQFAEAGVKLVFVYPANIEKLTGVSVDDVSRPSGPQEAIYQDRGQWTSVFLTRPEMTSSLLREMFRKAGVHVSSEDGDPFYANDELIALHSGGGGRRTFRLPEARNVTELFEDRTVSDSPVMEFTETFKPMETRLYWLERN